MMPAFSEVKQAAAAAIEAVELSRYNFWGKYARWRLLLAAAMVLNAAFAFAAPGWLALGIPALLLIGLIAWYVRQDCTLQYNRAFKETVVAEMAAYMVRKADLPQAGQDYAYLLDYEPQQHVGIDLIKQSSLVPRDAYVDKGEDLFSGRMGLTDFQFSKVKLVVDIEDSDSKSKMRVFKGICFIADFHKEFEGLTILHSHNAVSRGKAGKALRKLAYKIPQISLGADKEITLENPAFNEAFVMRSSDETEARYLLPANMMERLVDFRYRHQGRVDVSFFGSYICLLLGSGKNYFEAPLHREADGEHLRQIYDDLAFLFGIIEQLALNTRIWSKS